MILETELGIFNSEKSCFQVNSEVSKIIVVSKLMSMFPS